jgi:DNA-binding response OmpR family regulator
VLTLRELPELFHAEVDEAGNGEIALKLMEKAPYDLVLSDVRMPYMDGIELVRRVRESGDRRTPIVLISTLGSEDDVRRGVEAGADAYILKPIVPALIRASLREFLERLAREGRKSESISVRRGVS